MKKQMLLAASVLFTAGIIFLTGCKKDDTTAPTISVTGGTSQTQALPATLNGGTWTNPAATAEDDEDGDISSSITVSGTVNPNLKGTYTLTYSVSDAAGNTATETVNVSIYNACDFISGPYNADDTCQVSAVFPYVSTITPSTTINKEFSIQNFGGFGTSINVKASVSGSTTGSSITWNGAQGLGGTATLNSSAVTSPGSVTATSPVTFTLTYQWTDGASSEICTSLYTHQ